MIEKQQMNFSHFGFRIFELKFAEELNLPRRILSSAVA